MPRIRSIKPEFVTDGAVQRMSDSVALFFVLLWTHCDDEGKHPFDLDQLVAELGGRWHRGKCKLFVSCLIKSGQLRLNSDSTWIQVANWSHQRIDKPKQPKVKAADLQWLSDDESRNALDDSRTIHARIGSDRIREDRIGSNGDAQEVSGSNPPESNLEFEIDEPKKPRRKPAASAPLVTIGNPVVTEYFKSYAERYGGRAPLLGPDVAKLKTLGESLGNDTACDYVRSYFAMNTSWYVTKRHDVQTLMSNLNPVENFIRTGRIVTTADARNAEAGESLKNQMERLMRGGS